MAKIQGFQKWLIIALWTFLCLQYVTCQLNPQLESVVRRQKQIAEHARFIGDRREFFAERGVDVTELESLLKDDHMFAQFARAHLSEAVQGARHVQVEGNLWYGLDDDDDSLLSEKCFEDTMQYFSDLDNDVTYALRMRAAHGKIIPDFETAQYSLNLKDFGDLWMCTSNTANKTSGVPSFDAQYCGVIIPFAFGVIIWGTCTPNTCTTQEIQAVSNTIWTALGAPGPFVFYECNEPEEWRTADIAFLALLSFLLAMVIAGTFYEVYIHKIVLAKVLRETGDKQTEAAPLPEKPEIETSSVDEPEVIEAGSEVKENGAKFNGGFEKGDDPSIEGKVHRVQMTEEPKEKKPKIDLKWAILDGVMMSFSVVTNCRKLLSAKKTKGNLAALNGIRVISMFWVILGHAYSFYFGRLDNWAQTFEEMQSFGFLAIVNSTFSVDTFFVLSGFLTTYLTLKQLDSKRLGSAFSWFVFYFHRWWRLTPALMGTIGIWALLKPHFAEGVFTDGFHDMVRKRCGETWFSYMLYFNNLYPWPNDLENVCFGHGWYLANDMQYYIISPVILVILYRNRNAGMALIGSMMIVSLASLVGINLYYGVNMDPYYLQLPYNDRLSDYPEQDVTYTKPYTRIPPYLVGMVLGYIIFKLKGKKVKLNKIYVLLGWVCALGTLFAVIYGSYGCLNRYIEQWESVIYLTFSRLAWGIGIAWIIFACLNGYGGPIGVLLDWSFWIPMARLSYCAYLIHPTLQFSAMTFNKTLFHMDYLSLSFFYAGCLVFSYVTALLLSLVLESPPMGLEKVMFGKFNLKK